MTKGRHLLLALASLATCVALAGALHAETVRVRSGEHGSFTRIVAESGATDGWTLGRTDGGYELRLDAAADYDLAGAFRLIGRDRVASLSAGPLPGSLAIGLACNCHANAFRTPAGAIVIDVVPGPAPAGSPFEARLPATASAPGPAASPHAATAAATAAAMAARVAAGDEAESSQVAGTTLAENVRGFAAAATADPRLALFWRGVRLPDGGASPPDRSPPPEASFIGAGPAETTATSDAPASGAARDVSSAPEAPPLGAEAGAAEGADALRPRERSPGEGPAPLPDSGLREDPAVAIGMPVQEPAAKAPPMADARVTEAQTELLQQLSRAASQGLIEIETKPLRHEDGTRPQPPGTTAVPEPGNADLPPEGLPVHAETSIDRDAPSNVARPPVTPDGGACLPGEAFDIAAWGDLRPLTIQIAERRAALVGEFDRPSAEAVTALAKLYLHFGFGAESRAVLKAFDVEPEDRAVLADMGRILDGAAPGAGTSFDGMTGCDTPAALWAVMSLPGLPPATDVDTGAVVRAFSALPAHLRRLLGPGLVERLMSVGAASAAQSVRNAIARVPDDGGRVLDLVEAQIALGSGAPEDGERKLDPLARSNDPLSPEALILAIQSRLQRGEAVDPGLADTAEALAFERQNGPDGPLLAALHILSRASTGDFGRAFAAYRDWPGHPSGPVRVDTATRLFAMLAAKADDRTFLTLYFGHADMLEASAPDLLLRLDLGDRLAGAGFPSALRHLLKGETGYTERGRRLLARAALEEFRPAEALAQISGLAGPEAERLRAEALVLQGDHAAAAAGFGAIGDAERAALEAWRGGDLRSTSASGPAPIKAALEALGRSTGAAEAADTTGEAPTPPGPLAAGRTLVEETRAARAAIEALLAATPAASAPEAAAPMTSPSIPESPGNGS
ncbi:MAG: hypothetical protein V9G18_08765 [Albidovulum sp.]|jgi:hypothetical protein|uniref:hypothetical protein n=1 Tax=Albidovulum sp. TaxID=1872424 RepID=UPI0030446DC3